MTMNLCFGEKKHLKHFLTVNTHSLSQVKYERPNTTKDYVRADAINTTEQLTIRRKSVEFRSQCLKTKDKLRCQGNNNAIQLTTQQS